MYENTLNKNNKIVAVAPMMDWTDRHCRFFHRGLTKLALLYTEMVTCDAIIHGDQLHLLGFNECEHPVALQLGGSDPQALARASEIGASWGYDEINLNVGCPSDRVQSGAFGACLMRTPGLVADCVAAMKSAVDIPVTVKCRLGVDEQSPDEALFRLADMVFDRGSDALWVHARKAWLEGLSPKENRDIPPLDYEEVYRLKEVYPERFIGVNGGIEDCAAIKHHLSQVDGIMLGRAAYNKPAILAEFDALDCTGEIGSKAGQTSKLVAAARRMGPYLDDHLGRGGRANQITRHMLGLFSGYRGARRYRQIMTVDARNASSGAIIDEALSALDLPYRDNGCEGLAVPMTGSQRAA